MPTEVSKKIRSGPQNERVQAEVGFQGQQENDTGVGAAAADQIESEAQRQDRDGSARVVRAGGGVADEVFNSIAWTATPDCEQRFSTSVACRAQSMPASHRR